MDAKFNARDYAEKRQPGFKDNHADKAGIMKAQAEKNYAEFNIRRSKMQSNKEFDAEECLFKFAEGLGVPVENIVSNLGMSAAGMAGISAIGYLAPQILTVLLSAAAAGSAFSASETISEIYNLYEQGEKDGSNYDKAEEKFKDLGADIASLGMSAYSLKGASNQDIDLTKYTKMQRLLKNLLKAFSFADESAAAAPMIKKLTEKSQNTAGDLENYKNTDGSNQPSSMQLFNENNAPALMLDFYGFGY